MPFALLPSFDFGRVGVAVLLVHAEVRVGLEALGAMRALVVALVAVVPQDVALGEGVSPNSRNAVSAGNFRRCSPRSLGLRPGISIFR